MLDFTIKRDSNTHEPYLETRLTGKHLLSIPQLNKGTAFTKAERELFLLTGKLPAHIESITQQVKRAYLQYQSYQTPLQKNNFLNQLNDTNLILFYRLVGEHAAEMIPILYTPTVGEAVEKFSREFQQARGLYISYQDHGNIEKILDNRSHRDVDLIVASDGGGVLGIGDQGVGAMLIPVAKLMVYTIGCGINPFRTLPIMLDVGTDNKILCDDPFYLGWRHSRISGKQYDDFIEEFVTAIKNKFPNVFLHWEDFGRDNARRILDRYQDQLCSFNDDIQGTGAVTLAALLAAMKVTNTNLSDQRIIIFGAGTAGTGIADQISETMIREGIPKATAQKQFWLLARKGLIVENMENITPAQRPYARTKDDIKSWSLNDPDIISLHDVIKHIKPTVLIGCSTKTGAFDQAAIEEMDKHVEHPIIFPLSNPTEKSEATPADLMQWTNGKALIATGSPFDPVTFKDQQIPIPQCNNALIFPGLGLGIIAANAKRVTDNMLWAACETLANCAPINSDPKAPLLPTIQDAKQAARKIAIAVGKQAKKDGVTDLPDSASIEKLVDEKTWEPAYLPYRKPKKL